MFRVPQDADRPTFDHTFKVGFGRWLTSSGRDRREWGRRRNAAARLATQNQQGRFDAVLERERERSAQRATTPAPARGRPQDPAMRRLYRLAGLEMWLSSIQLVLLLLPVVVFIVVCVAGVIWIALSG